MRINRIQCYHYNRAFTVPFDSLQTQRRHADSVIVRISCDNGVSGFGEGAPRPYVTGEDVASVVACINSIFAPILFSSGIKDLDTAAGLLTQCEAACQNNAIKAYQAALAAIDLALMDILENADLLSSASLYGRQLRQQLPFSASVPFLPRNLIKDFFPLLNAKLDIKIIKILIDDNPQRNRERVQLIQSLANADQELRLEANGKLSFDQIQNQLDHLQPFGIAAIEQPLPPADNASLPKLRKSSGMAIIADESLVSIADAHALIELEGCDVFNIKVSKCGGILRARAIANLAAAHGIDCHVGTHVGETELLGAAGRRLACALPNFDAYGGGSSVLFSRLFAADSDPQPRASTVPEKENVIAPSAREDLLRQSQLISDTGKPSGAKRIDPFGRQPREDRRSGDTRICPTENHSFNPKGK